jgi:hypothetical protein
MSKKQKKNQFSTPDKQAIRMTKQESQHIEAGQLSKLLSGPQEYKKPRQASQSPGSSAVGKGGTVGDDNDGAETRLPSTKKAKTATKRR